MSIIFSTNPLQEPPIPSTNQKDSKIIKLLIHKMILFFCIIKNNLRAKSIIILIMAIKLIRRDKCIGSRQIWSFIIKEIFREEKASPFKVEKKGLKKHRLLKNIITM